MAHLNQPTLEPTQVTVSKNAVGSFLGIDDEIAIEHLRTQPIVEARLNRGGTSISFRLKFADGSRAAFKPLQRNPQTVPRKEVAAYRINRLLGLRGVPPATMRTLHRDDLVAKLSEESPFWVGRAIKETIFDQEGFTRGEVSFWIPRIADSQMESPLAIAEWTKYLTADEIIPTEKLSLMTQLSALLILDELGNNSDRFSGGNLSMAQDGQTLYFMDNTFGFQPDPQGNLKCRSVLMRCQKFSRRLVEAMRRLDLASLRRAFVSEPGVLSEQEMEAVISRNHWALGYIDRLIATLGRERVLVFP